MIDVTPFMPALNEIILQGDALAQPPCWTAKFAIESYQGGTKTKAESLEMLEISKSDLYDSYYVTGSNTDTYSYNTAMTTINNLIAAFTE